VTIDIDRKATEQTRWPARGNHVVGMLTKGGCLPASYLHAQSRRVTFCCKWFDRVFIVISGNEFLYLHHHAVVARVVGNANRANNKFDFW
jgi:hypothetical protein